jgi:hypothetical protein
MPQDPNFYIIVGAFAVLCVGIVSTLSLRGWRDWIALKHAELDLARQGSDAPVPSATVADRGCRPERAGEETRSHRRRH